MDMMILLKMHHCPYLRGCCKRDAISSTVSAPAIAEIPGLVTVHCWSRVLSLWDCEQATKSAVRCKLVWMQW
jgi:hypothetical protein